MEQNKGITIIELVAGMAILAIAGLMVASMLASSVRMYRTTVAYSDLQTESQAVSRRLTGMAMNASGLCIDDYPDGFYLFTGTITEGSDYTIYSGAMVWFNKETGCLYQNDSVSIKAVSNSNVDFNGENIVPLTLPLVRDAMENGADQREYLISDKVKKLEVSIFPEPLVKKDYYFSTVDQNITIYFTLVMANGEEEEYEVSTAATPRNRIGKLHYSRKTD